MIYLDNAATTFPKPAAVTESMRICMQEYCGNPGRGTHKLSLRAAEKVFECRETAAELFGAADADRVFFTPNATFGINAVIKGLLKKGDHAIISDMEHNAVWRPIHKLAEQGLIEYDIFKTYEMCDIPLFSERFVEICNSNNLSGISFEKTQDYDSKNRDFFSREKLIEFFGTDIIK